MDFRLWFFCKFIQKFKHEKQNALFLLFYWPEYFLPRGKPFGISKLKMRVTDSRKKENVDFQRLATTRFMQEYLLK